MKNKASLLRQTLGSKRIVRLVGAHNGLGAKLIERNGFEGIWASGLEISTSYAVPDANILTMTENLHAASAMNEASSLPVICDCDTGYGNAANVMHMVKKYEAAGLAAVVIEDKIFPKVNSFVAGRQELAPISEFAGKIEAATSVRLHSEFMVFARVEALIAGWGIEEALKRAAAYAEAGADGIVIHSKEPVPEEIFEFARRWKGQVPLVAIPTMYPQVTTGELAQRGFKMVIYANQGLRASIRAMDEVFRTIRENGSTAAVEGRIAPMREVFDIQGMTDLKKDEKKFLKGGGIQAVIPAAADNRGQTGLSGLLYDKPLCMLEIGSKTLIERQMGLLRSCGVQDICVVSGYRGDQIRAEGATLLENPDYSTTSIAHSVLSARTHIKGRAVMVYSDIIFDRHVLQQLLTSPHQVTLVVDSAYRTLPFRDKALDLVIVEDPAANSRSRRLDPNMIKPVRLIGTRILKEEAHFEFIGMAFFREEGWAQLVRAWAEALERFGPASDGHGRPFYEASNVSKADFTDLMQYLIDRGQPVYAMEIEHGWSEIHSLEDYRRVQAYFSAEPNILAEKK